MQNTSPVNEDEMMTGDMQDTTDMMADDMTEDEMMTGDNMDDDMMDNSTAPSYYQDYDETAVQAALVNGNKVAYFFHASRCPTCRSLEEDIMANPTAFGDDVSIFKVDYDTATELKQQYGVTTQHTIVLIDQDMNELQKDIGTDFAQLQVILG